MHGGEAQGQAKRLGGRAGVEEGEGVVPEAGRLVSSVWVFGVDKIWSPLAFFALPEIKLLDGGGGGRSGANAEFADETGAVPVAAELAGIGVAPLDRIEAGGKIFDVVTPHPLSREDAGSTYRADRRGDKAVAKDDAFGGHGIEVRRNGHRVAHEAGGVPAQVIDQDKDEVGRWAGRRGCGCGCGRGGAGVEGSRQEGEQQEEGDEELMWREGRPGRSGGMRGVGHGGGGWW